MSRALPRQLRSNYRHALHADRSPSFVDWFRFHRLANGRTPAAMLGAIAVAAAGGAISFAVFALVAPIIVTAAGELILLIGRW